MLLIVAVATLASMFVMCCLPCAADTAVELHTCRINSSEQAQQHMSIAACDNTFSGACAEYIAMLSKCTLTIAVDVIADI